VATRTTTPRAEASRQRLIDAACAELVERDGMLEVASVAARAGVSVGLIYRHFGSKAGLVAAVVDDFYNRLDAAVLPDPAPQADWATRERMRVGLAVEFHYDDPLAPVILSRLSREPEVAAVEARWIARQIEGARRNIAKGQADGELPADFDPGMAGAMTLGGIRQTLGEVLARRRRPPRDAVAEELWRLVVGAVRFTARP
jgi:AcrR family transcriptional regulator